jgi:hypothetical protein
MDSLNHAGSRGPSVTFDCTNSVGGEDDIRRRRIPVGVAAREGGVRAGEELLSYYGAKPNWNFLTSYGFVSDEDVSQETTLTASLDPSDGLFSAKREALARLGLASEEQLFDIQASEPPSAKVRFTPRLQSTPPPTPFCLVLVHHHRFRASLRFDRLWFSPCHAHHSVHPRS